MKDTSPEIEDLYRKLLMGKSGSDRLKMASDMFDSARTLVRSSLKSQNLPPKHLDWEVFLRIYGNDFDENTLSKVFNRHFTPE